MWTDSPRGDSMAVSVNYLAVLVAAVASMALGFAWYSQALFGKAWMKAMKISKKDMAKTKKKGCAGQMTIAFIAALVMAYVLSYFIGYAGASTIAAGAQVGFWVWLGFIATVQIGIVLWDKKPMKLFIINTGHYLVNLVVMGAILAVWA